MSNRAGSTDGARLTLEIGARRRPARQQLTPLRRALQPDSRPLKLALSGRETAHKTKARPPTRSGLALCVFVASTQTCTDCSVHSREVAPCAEPVLMDLENHRLTGARKDFAFEPNASYHFDAHHGRVRVTGFLFVDDVLAGRVADKLLGRSELRSPAGSRPRHGQRAVP